MKRNLLIGLAGTLGILALVVWLFLRDDAPDPQSSRAARTAAVEGDVGDLSPAPVEPRESGQAESAAREPAAAIDEVAEELPGTPPLLKGRVLGEGEGIAGAELRLFAVAEIWRVLGGLEKIVPQGGEMPDIPLVIAGIRGALAQFRDLGRLTSTDEAGEFELYEADPGGYFVVTSASGWVYHFGDVVSLQVGATAELTVELDRGKEISGSVLSPTGVPIAGATVIAEYRPPGMPGVGKLVRRVLKLINGEFLKGPFEVKTDASGQFAFDSLPEGVYDLAGSGPGGVETRLEFVQTGTSGAIVMLGAGAVVHGFLVDGDDVPVGDVEIQLQHMEDRIELPLPAAGFNAIANTVNRYLGAEPRVQKSRGDGAFIFGMLGAGKYQLSIEQRGLLPYSRQLEVDWGGTLDLGAVAVDRGKSIRGVVLDEEGSPVESAVVMAVPRKLNFFTGPAFANDFATSRLTTRSRADGTFRLGGLRRTKYGISASRSGYAPASRKDVTGDSEPVELILRAGVTIAGKVVLAGTEDGVAGLKVECRDIRARTDEKGLFVLRGVVIEGDREIFPFGDEDDDEDDGEDDDEKRDRRKDEDDDRRRVRLTVDGSGYLAARAEFDPEEIPEEIVLEVEPAPAIQGIAYDPDGEPAPGALIRLTPAMPAEFEQMGFFDTALIFLGVTVSDLEGRFRFDRFPGGDEGADLRIVADHVLYARGKSEDFRFGLDFDPDSEVEVRLVAGGKISGVVTDGRSPIAGATVRLRHYREVSQGEKMFFNILGLPKGGETVHTGKDGEYTFHRVVPGSYAVSAEVEGFTEAPEQRLAMEAGDEHELHFELDPGGSIFGDVSDPAGEKLAGAKVRVIRKTSSPKEMVEAQKFLGASFKSSVTTEEGAFHIDGLPAGTYVVVVEKKGYLRVELDPVEPGDQPFSFVLTSAAQIRGQVVDAATQAPVTSFTVDVRRTDGEDGDGELAWFRKRKYDDPQGRFQRQELRSGVYRVGVSAAGFVPVSTQIELFDGALEERRFALERSGRIVGSIVDTGTSRPLVKARIRLLEDSQTRAGDGQRDRETKSGVPRVGDDADRPPEKSDAELRAEDVAALREHYVSGRLGESVEIEEDGSFVIDTLPDGPQMLVVSHPDYVEDVRRGLSVGRGETLDLHFRLSKGLHVSGKVLEPSGHAAQRASVFLRGVSPGNSLVRKTARVADDGRFRVDGLQPGSYRVMPVRRGEGARAAATRIELESSRTDVELTLLPAAPEDE